MSEKSLVFGSDHAGLGLKGYLIKRFKPDYEIIDVGANKDQSCDYPEYAVLACREVLERGCPGILVCGTGLGMSMMANRIKGIRAALCANEFMARMSRLHNNANVLCLGDRIIGSELGAAIAAEFLACEFEAGRHARRVDMIDSLI
ncbi:MAG: ribose 5-phosphate isomerase B [Desulfonatronovibrionaceae bacterium]